MTDMIRDAERSSNACNEELNQESFEFFLYVKRHLRAVLIPVIAAIMVTALYVYVIASPVYEATTQVYVVNTNDAVIDLSDLQIGSDLTNDYLWLFKVWEVNQQVIDNLNLPYSLDEMQERLIVENSVYSRILRITFASENAKEAADVANEYSKVASQYISEYIRTGQPEVISAALAPSTPARPKKLLVVTMIGLLTACFTLCGLFIAFMVDNKVKSAADLQKHMGVEPLAVIPETRVVRRTRKAR